MNLPEEEVNAINTSLVKYFIQEGYLRAMVLAHYQSASIVTEFLEQEGVLLSLDTIDFALSMAIS